MIPLLLPVRLLATCALLLATAAAAQQSERFGPWELHYNVVNSTFITPEVAAQYGIVRGDDRAFVNIALREHRDDGTAVTHPMQLEGESWDLTGRRTRFDFIEVREGTAVYYIGEFRFLNREWRHFALEFNPEGSDRRFRVRFKRQLYRQQ